LTRYPNATEIGNTGIWDTPYEGHEFFTDNHPLVEPVAVNSELPAEEPLPTTLIVAVGVIVAVVGLGLLVYFKKRKLEVKS
jgi:LPXTG-motif cell wall-anchored protein